MRFIPSLYSLKLKWAYICYHKWLNLFVFHSLLPTSFYYKSIKLYYMQKHTYLLVVSSSIHILYNDTQSMLKVNICIKVHEWQICVEDLVCNIASKVLKLQIKHIHNTFQALLNDEYYVCTISFQFLLTQNVNWSKIKCWM